MYMYTRTHTHSCICTRKTYKGKFKVIIVLKLQAQRVQGGGCSILALTRLGKAQNKGLWGIKWQWGKTRTI